MAGYLSFEADITSMHWGKSIYTVLPLPDDIATTLAQPGAKRIEGEFNDHPVNLTIAKAPIMDGVFLWARKSLRHQIGISANGGVAVRLRKAADADFDTPDELALALQNAEKSEAWQALTPGKKRRLLYGINSAKGDKTRQRRITKLIGDLS